MIRSILHFHHSGLKALEEGTELEKILSLLIREKISKMKFFAEEDSDILDVYIGIDAAFQELLKQQ